MEHFKKSLKNAVEQHIPTKTIRLNRANERVWLNKGMLTININNLECSTIFKIIRKRNKNTFRKMEREYYHQTLYQPSLQGLSKPFYSLLKRKNGKCSHTLSFITEQEIVSDKANHFNWYVHGVFFLNLTLHALETLVVMEQQLLWLLSASQN